MDELNQALNNWGLVQNNPEAAVTGQCIMPFKWNSSGWGEDALFTQWEYKLILKFLSQDLCEHTEFNFYHL